MPPSLVSPLPFWLWLREHGGFPSSPLRQFPEENQTPPELDNWTWLLLFAGGTAMMIFSGLMYLLAFKIKAVCLHCVVSALLSLSLFTLALIGRDWHDIGQLVLRICGGVVVLWPLGVYAHVNNPVASTKGDYAITLWCFRNCPGTASE